MEVPAPESGEATATGKRGPGVGRAPESPGGGRVRGRRAAGTPSRAARRLGGVARGRRGGGGVRRALGGRGRARPLSPGLARFRFSRRGRAVCRQWRVSSPLPAAPDRRNPKTSGRGAAVASEAALPRVWARALGGRAGGWRGEPGRAAWPWRSRAAGGARPGPGYLLPGAPGRAPGALGVPGPRSARRAGQERPLPS